MPLESEMGGKAGDSGGDELQTLGMLKSLNYRRSQMRKRLAESQAPDSKGRKSRRANGTNGWHNSLYPEFKVFPFESNIDKKHVIVIGAGAAGLAAAACLKRAGIEVTVLEARERIGGRIHTDTDHFGYPIDLGATIITGIGSKEDRPADALGPMCRSLGIPVHTLDHYALPLYDSITGSKFPGDIDKQSAMLFDRILDEAAEYQMLAMPSRVKNLALGEVFNKLLDLHFECVPCNSATTSENHGSSHGSLQGSQHTDEAINEVRNIINVRGRGRMRGRGRRGRGGRGRGSRPRYMFSPKAEPLEGITLTNLHKELIVWHQAHLEYGCGADLGDVSLATWNQDEAYGGFSGAHAVVEGGVGKVIKHLAMGLDVRTGQVVDELEYGEDGVRIKTKKGDEFRGGIAILTVPLGVLKDDRISFQPPLPSWKTEAVNALGFGNMNKVVLEFKKVFWDVDVDYFGISPGFTEDDYKNRGFCTLWWSGYRSTGRPMLTGIISGSLSTEVERMSDIEIIEWGLKRLKSIFGPDLPTMVNHKVTRWGKDPFSRGCYTYLPRGASGEHYDILGQPILGMGFGLLFGGEHTVKEHPDTVGGAFISGVREVQRVLSLFGLQPLKVEETQKENEEDKFCIIREDGYDSFGRKIRKHGQKELTDILIREADRARNHRPF